MKIKIYKIAPFVLYIIMLLSSSSQLQAQQDSQFTQYMYNTQTINPAYVGTKGLLEFLSLYRAQWVGLEGAPKTLSFTAGTPLTSRKMGLGLSFTKDQIGPADESTIAVDFSYSIRLNENNIMLSFGVKGGINLLNVDYSVLDIYDPNDALQQNDIDNRLTPIIGAGFYLHNNKNWYAGISVPNFLETTYYDDTSVSNASEKMSLYAIGGYVFTLSNSTKFKPAVLGKFVSGSPIALDISANFLIHDKFTVGAAYRLDAAVSGLVAFQMNNGLTIGYAYDYGIQKLTNYNSGSHEIFLRFQVLNKISGKVSPRFF